MRARAPGAGPGPLRQRQPGRDTWCLDRPRSRCPRPLGLNSPFAHRRSCGRREEKGGDQKGRRQEVGRRDVGAVRAARGRRGGTQGTCFRGSRPAGSVWASRDERIVSQLFPGATWGRGRCTAEAPGSRGLRERAEGRRVCLRNPLLDPAGIPEQLRSSGWRPPRCLHPPQ